MITLSEVPTTPPTDLDKGDAKKETKAWVDRIGDLQDIMYAEGKHSLLVVFQGMDASGKDGAVRNIFKKCHPNGIHTHSFKKPTEEEFAHDFLWRVHQVVPPKGMIKVFNRSHYEDILIQRVHGWIDEETVQSRMDAINAFENLLAKHNNTTILKFFLYVSYDQQAIELQQRIDEKDKHWKHNSRDWKEREHWADYMRCYEYAINNSIIPWTIVPVDDRWYRDYIVSSTIVAAMERMNMEYPPIKKD